MGRVYLIDIAYCRGLKMSCMYSEEKLCNTFSVGCATGFSECAVVCTKWVDPK